MSSSRDSTGSSGAFKSVRSNKKRSRAALWECESLEVRRLFATVSWVAQGDGDWSVGSNWNTGTVPQPGDNVIIDVPGVNLTVTYDDTPTLQLGNLVNTESLVLNGMNGATWNGGTFDGSGFVTNDTTLTIGGSADKIIKDGLAIENLGMIAMTGTGNIVGVVGASISNEAGATFDFQSDADITFPAGVGDGLFENAGTVIKSVGAAGASTDIGGPQGFTFENSINDTVAPQFNIPGNVEVLQGTLALGDNQNVSLTSGGTFQISAGATLNYNEGTENIVVLRPPNGAPQILPSITGGGTLEVSGGTLQMYGIVQVHEIDVSAGSLLLQQNMQEVGGTPQRNTTPTVTPFGTSDILRLSGGTFGGNGGGIFSVPPPIDREEEPALVVGTTFQWTGGTLSGAGRLVIDVTVVPGQSTISTAAPKAINGGFGLDLLTETDWSGSGTITMNGNSAIYIHSGGTLWDQSDGTITQGIVDANGGSVWNAGIILKLNGAGTTTFGPGISVINDYTELNFVTAAIPIIQYPDLGNSSGLFAKIDIRTGTVSIQGSSTNRNTILIHPGAALSYVGGVHLNQSYANANDVNDASILGVDGGGTIIFGAGAFSSDNQSLVDVPTAFFGTGTYSFDNTAPGAQRTLVATYTGGATGSIGGNGTIEIVNSLAWNSGIFTGTGGLTSNLLIDPGAVLTLGSGNYMTANNYAVNNEGTLQWATSPGTLTVGGNYNQTATGVFDSTIVAGVPDTIEVTGSVNIAGTLNLSVASLTPTAGETYTLIDNTGVNPIVGTFNGYPEGTVITIGQDIFKLSYVGGTGNDLTLTSIINPNVTILTPPVFVRALTGVTNLVFTVALSAATNINVTVNYFTTPGTAVAGIDYTTTAGTLTIPAGQTSAMISVPIIGTAQIEPAKTFTMTLTMPMNSNLGTPFTAIATIVAVNGPPALSFGSGSFTVDENAGVATIVVQTSNSTIASSVSYNTVDGSAVAGVDYTAASGTLNFAVGVSQLTFTVPIIDENITQGSKDFSVVLSNPVGSGAVVGTSAAAVTILDNDGLTPTLTIANQSVTEPISGSIPIVFTLTLSAASTLPVSVEYATANGTAVEGKYIAQSGTITLVPGQTSAQIAITVNSDFIQTAAQTFSINLSDPVNVDLVNASATGTILSQAVTTITILAGQPFRYRDAFNQRATISLSGPGTGTITYLGLTTNDAKQIVLNGTTAQSTLSIGTSRGLTGITNIIVNGPLKAINAPGVLLINDLNVTGGVQTLRLNSLLAASAVNIGSGGGIGLSNVILASVTDADIISALPLGTVKVGNWQDTGGTTGIIAPSANRIAIAHNFRTNVSLTGNLGAMSVGGLLNGSIIRVGGSINTFTVGTVSNSDIFVGAQAGVTTLPSSTSQFVNTTSTIGRFSVISRRPAGFLNTNIAAPIIGIVQLGDVLVANSGTLFGIAGTLFQSVKGRGSQVIKLTDPALVASPFSDTDLRIRLTT